MPREVTVHPRLRPRWVFWVLWFLSF